MAKKFLLAPLTQAERAQQIQQVNQIFPPEEPRAEAPSPAGDSQQELATTTYTRSFLHHGMPCEVSCEINSTCNVLAFVNGQAVYSRYQVYKAELEGYLVTAMKLVEVEAERRHPLGAEVDATQRMLLRLGFVKQENTV
ncbi:hypothetical protein LX87_05450 [Larkinella arboricola]|uniref:Uncharacterized protein n=1 Tax=Larkinella arboricola TaxID=643671 RepID=A0A327WL07_LARAB|nr:hypothetical protein [Larkinella arboricola]RAJ90821.1 hypothetical protein LX87_05450 [Larkinella arboricola]